METRNERRPAVRRVRPAPRRPGTWRTVTACLCLTALACSSGCQRTLCPAEAKSVGIMVRVSPAWATEGLRIRVGCPEGRECGFLDGPVSGDARQPVTIATVLRPPAVRVEVIEESTGRMVAEGVAPVTYHPRGMAVQVWRRRDGRGRVQPQLTARWISRPDAAQRAGWPAGTPGTRCGRRPAGSTAGSPTPGRSRRRRPARPRRPAPRPDGGPRRRARRLEGRRAAPTTCGLAGQTRRRSCPRPDCSSEHIAGPPQTEQDPSARRARHSL